MKLLTTLLAASSLVLASANAGAAIRYDQDGELVLVIWDPIKEVSYTKDMGIDGSSFFVQAQQDAGFQQFWTLDSSDAAFKKLRDLGTASDQLQWAIVGVADTGQYFSDTSGLRFFQTLGQGPDDGTLNPNYTAMLAQHQGDWVSVGPPTFESRLMQDLNNNTYAGNGHSVGGSDNWAVNGSAYTPKGMPGYFGANELPTGAFMHAAITNPVGKSSWFYTVTMSVPAGDANDDTLVAADEFDNLGHDGYWGLAEDPSTHNFVLSYTIESATLTPAEAAFARSIGRTERSTTFAVRKLAGEAASSLETSAGTVTRLAGAAAISPVPEPSSLGLFGLGLGVLAALQRRRTRR